MRRLLLVLVVGGVSCAPAERAGTAREAIYGGTVAPDDRAVFFVQFANGGACSGALIAPRTILTAAHCVDSPIASVSNEVMGWEGTRYRVVQQRSYSGTPGDWTPDLGLVLLAEAPPVTPLRWMAAGPMPQVGTLVRHVGYGITEAGSFGERRQVTIPITGAGAPGQFGVSLTSGANGQGICSGDSGGPALVRDGASEVIAGVHSYGNFMCGTSSGSALIFPYHRFVEDWLAQHEAASCARDRRCVAGCVPADLDCTCGPDGQCSPSCIDGDDPDCPASCAPDSVCSPAQLCPVDLDCLPTGTQCLRESQCASRVCLNDPQNPSTYCSVSCATTPCPTGFQCSAQATCVKAQRTALPAGSACQRGDLCANGMKCSAALGAPARCIQACESSLTCLGGMGCDFSQGVCVPSPPIVLDAGLEGVGPVPKEGCSSVPFPSVVLALLVVRRKR